MSQIEISARSVEKRFGPVAALRGVDLDVEGGRAVAVLGPNGAGKSTLLRILAGLARPTAGSVSIRRGGRAPDGRGRARAWVGFAGHATLLYPELTARENLVFHGRLQGVVDPNLRADQLLDEEGLTPVADRRVRTFSRGMAQRLSIARALVQDPPLLLLDEPFTGLDRRAGDRLSERLQRLRSEGRAILLVTHDLLRASEIADAALILLSGQILQRAEGSALERVALEATYAEALESEVSAG
ncbi:MAG: heme ABC exporter ATP-binding protein CcmA [Myxococcota bacterium]